MGPYFDLLNVELHNLSLVDGYVSLPIDTFRVQSGTAAGDADPVVVGYFNHAVGHIGRAQGQLVGHSSLEGAGQICINTVHVINNH